MSKVVHSLIQSPAEALVLIIGEYESYRDYKTHDLYEVAYIMFKYAEAGYKTCIQPGQPEPEPKAVSNIDGEVLTGGGYFPSSKESFSDYLRRSTGIDKPNLAELARRELDIRDMWEAFKEQVTASHSGEGWVSCEDSLPEVHEESPRSETVIIRVIFNQTEVVTSGYRNRNLEWCWLENHKPISKEFIVTHWQNLPKPPQSK